MRRLPGPPARGARGDRRRRPARPAPPAGGRAAAARRGANVNLAPVADVARPDSALARDGRLFGSSPRAVAAARASRSPRACARPASPRPPSTSPGSARRRRPPTPRRCGSTSPRASCAAVDMAPFAALIARDVPLVMLGTAVYPALDPRRPAALSRPIATGELRGPARLRRGDRHRRPRHARARAGRRSGGGRGAGGGRGQRPRDVHRASRTGSRRPARCARRIASDPAARADSQQAVARVIALRERLR